MPHPRYGGSYVGLGSIIGDGGLAASLVRRRGDVARIEYSTALTTVVCIAGSMAVALFVFAPFHRGEESSDGERGLAAACPRAALLRPRAAAPTCASNARSTSRASGASSCTRTSCGIRRPSVPLFAGLFAFGAALACQSSMDTHGLAGALLSTAAFLGTFGGVLFAFERRTIAREWRAAVSALS